MTNESESDKPHPLNPEATEPAHNSEHGHPHPHAAPTVSAVDEHGHDHPHEATGSSHPHGAADDHRHDQGYDHDHGEGLLARLRELVPFLHGHSHDPLAYRPDIETNQRGIWALKVSLIILSLTAALQVAVFAASGSVALLADTIHNFTDAMTAVPLWIAFVLGRRAASRRYTYGYGRAEDIAGVFIVLVILASAVLAAYESYRHLMDPRDLNHIEWVMAAAIVGFIGNEIVAELRIRVGREISSAALIADGHHARVDGLTSLAVLVGALGVLAGFDAADPIIGAIISIAILFIVKDVAGSIWQRLMDAVDPEVYASVERAAEAVAAGSPGVESVSDLRVRWLGHRLQAELSLMVDEEMTTRDSHQRAEELRHAMYHAVPQLASIIVHVEPCGHGGADAHETTAHHRAPGS